MANSYKDIFLLLKSDTVYSNLDSTLKSLHSIEKETIIKKDNLFLAELYGFTAGKYLEHGDYNSSINCPDAERCFARERRLLIFS